MAATLKCDTLQNASSATANITLDTAGNATVGNTLAMGSSFLRNRIINGAMQIWQRGTSNTSINNAPAYVADRWYGFVGASVTEEQIIQSTDVPTGFQYSAKYGRPSGNAQTNSIWFCQNIESVNMLDTIGQNVTLSFYAKKGANYSGGNMTVRVATGTTADQSAATFSGGPATGYTGYSALIDTTQALTTSWVRYTFTSAGTVASNALEMAVAFGYTPTGTASTDDNIYITGVQLEVGSVATPFERRQYGQELALCQRYCYVGTGLCIGRTFSTTQVSFQPIMPVTMRSVPSITTPAVMTFVVPGTNSYTQSSTTSGAGVDGTGGVTGFLVNLNNFSGMTSGVVGYLYSAAIYILSSEL